MFGQQNNNQQQGTGFGGFGTNNNTGSGMSSTCLFRLTHSLDTVLGILPIVDGLGLFQS